MSWRGHHGYGSGSVSFGFGCGILGFWEYVFSQIEFFIYSIHKRGSETILTTYVIRVFLRCTEYTPSLSKCPF